MNGECANLAMLDVGQAIGGVEKESGRSGVERNSDSVEGEVAAAEILHDGGPADFGARTRTDVVIVARGGDAAFNFAREEQLDVTEFFVLGKNLGAAFFELAGHLGRIAFDGEVEVAQSSACDQIPDGTAREVDIEAHSGGQFLNGQQGRGAFG